MELVKQQLFRAITGFLKTNTGTIKVLGKSIENESNSIRARIGYLPQEHGFPTWMTGREFLKFCAQIFGVPNPEVNSLCESLLEKTGIADAADRRIKGYSTGMKQRLGIAQALINKPDLVILDEPVSSLDPIGRMDVLKLISDLGRESAVLMSSHILNDIERVCDHIAIIDSGKIIISESAKDLTDRFTNPILEISISGKPEYLADELKRAEFVSSVQILEGGSLQIFTNNLTEATEKLPGIVNACNFGLLEYSIKKPTLESIFLSLVKNRGGKL